MPEQTQVPTQSRTFFRRADELLTGLRARVDESLNAVVPRRVVSLPPALEASRKTMRSHRGQVLSYYEDKTQHGRPLVLIHSINACASAYEMKPLFERFRTTRPVYAVDLPGFGFSERDARDYTPELYTAELIDFLTRVKDKGDAADIVALSLSCELMSRVAAARKDLVHTLTFISPTGFEKPGEGHGRPLLRSTHPSRHWWSPIAFGAIASRPSIRYFLGKSFVGPVDEDLRSYAYATSHQPGAEHAPLAFLSGQLFTPDIYETYAQLGRPVLALYDRDGYTRFDRLQSLVEGPSMWTAKRISPTLGMPHFERLAETASALEEFWREHSHAHHS
jgi:pimeloyl-ACP methyl ester carboxylesterase